VDLVVAVVLAGFAVRGLIKGFFRELLSLVGLFLGLWVALLKFTQAGDWIRARFPLAEPLPYHLGFLLLFFGISILASVGGFILHKLARVLLMGWLDAVGGLGFGLLKGVVMLVVLLFLLDHLPLPDSVSTQLRNSVVVSHLELVNPFLEHSLQTYERFGGKHLWERLRAPESRRPSTLGRWLLGEFSHGKLWVWYPVTLLTSQRITRCEC
jgi:membrane protein required for colicin V production